MRICTKHNLTASFMKVPANEYGYFDWKQKRAKGLFAKTMLNDFFLMKKYETQDDIFRYCNFLPTEEMGGLLENGSYDGAIGEVINFRADFFLTPQNLYINQNLVDVSDVATADYISIGHYIDKIDKKQTIITYLDKIREIIAPSFNFFIEYCSLFLLSFIFVFILNLILKKFSNLKLNPFELIFNLFNQEITIIKKLNFMGVFFLFFSIFLFFIKELISSSMNTNHIIVDIDQLMYSEDQIYRTEKEVCWFSKTKELDYHKYSLNNSLSHFIFYERMNKTDPCFFTDYVSPNNFFKKKLSKNFFLFSYGTILELLKSSNQVYQKEIFISKKTYLTENAVFYLSKKMNKLAKNDINYYSSFLLTYGLYKKVIREANGLLSHLFPQNKKTFYSTKEYIDYYTFTEPLKLADLPCIYFYLFFLILISICFILDHLNRLIRIVSVLNFVLKYCLYILSIVFNLVYSLTLNLNKKIIRTFSF